MRAGLPFGQLVAADLGQLEGHDSIGHAYFPPHNDLGLVLPHHPPHGRG